MNNVIKVILILLLCLVIKGIIDTRRQEHMIDVPAINDKICWNKSSNCKHTMVKAFKEFLDENNIKQSDSNWHIYFPCTYNNMKKEVKEVAIESSDADKRVFMIDGADEITSKNYLWDNLREAYGLDEARKLMPNTYVLFKKDDLDRLRREYNKNLIYIAKKNIQRQRGLLITKDANILFEGSKKGYVVAQELLQNPYLVGGRKINLRVYVAVFCRNGEVSCHAFNDGFMYYTRELFRKDCTEDGPNITTGYIDRKVYEENPLTHADFRIHLDDPNRELTEPELDVRNRGEKISDIVFSNIYELMRKVMMSSKNKLCSDGKLRNQISFQLFGADVAVNNKLGAEIIEINKGPDLGYKDERDGSLKKKVIYDIFSMLKIVPEKDNGFVELF